MVTLKRLLRWLFGCSHPHAMPRVVGFRTGAKGHEYEVETICQDCFHTERKWV